jgi:hypothetical protein
MLCLSYILLRLFLDSMFFSIGSKTTCHYGCLAHVTSWFQLFSCFLFFNFELVTWCIVNALIKGEIEDQVCPRTSRRLLLSDD